MVHVLHAKHIIDLILKNLNVFKTYVFQINILQWMVNAKIVIYTLDQMQIKLNVYKTYVIITNEY